MPKKRPNSSRLFQLALNDAIKSSAVKLERNSQGISTKEMIPQTAELKHEIASKPMSSLVQQHSSISLPYSKDLNKSCQKTSKPAADCISDFLPVSLSKSSSNYSSAIKNPISVQDSSNSIYALPISLCEPSNLHTVTECHNPNWIDPPRYNPMTFSKEFGDQPGGDLFPKHLIGTTCNHHFSKESRTAENELCSIGFSIPAPKSADDFFNSSSYTDPVNTLKYESVIRNTKSLNILSDSYMLGNQWDQRDLIAIPSPKLCDSKPTSFSFPVVESSTNTKVLPPSPKDYDSILNSEHPIPNPRSPNSFNSFPFSDEICLSNTGIHKCSLKTYKSFASSVPLTDNVCSKNCDKIVLAKQQENYYVELNSYIYHNEMITNRSNCSCEKSGWRSHHSGEDISNSYSFESCNCNLPNCDIYASGSKPNNLCQQLPILRDCEEKLQSNIACDNLFSNDYLDELIKMGSNDFNISRIEKDCLEDVPKADSKLLNLNDNATKLANKGNCENPKHIFNLENQHLKSSPNGSFHIPTLEDFKEISINQKRAVKPTNSSMCHLDVDYMLNQSINIVPHSQNNLDQLGTNPKIKSEFCKKESKLKIPVPPFLGHFDILSEDSTDHLAVSETKFIENSFKFEDNMKATNNYVLSFDPTEEFSTSNFTTSLDSLVDSNFENSSDKVNMTDGMSVDSCISPSTNSSNESIASEQIYNSFEKDVFCSGSKSKNLLVCNRLVRSSLYKNNSFSGPSTSIDSGIQFLADDAVSTSSLSTSSTYSEPALNVFPFIPKDKSSKLLRPDKNMNNANCEDKYTETSTKFSESEDNSSDFLMDDKQRIDNLIAQFMGM